MKSFFQGKPLREVYPHATRFQVFKYRMKQLLRRIAIVTVGGATFFCVYYIGLQQAQIQYVRGETVEVIRGGQTLKELKAEMIGKIWKGESQKYEPTAGEIWMIYDPPKVLRESGACQKRGVKLPWECFSFGPMQWKIETLQGFYKQIYSKEISEMEAMTIANDLTMAQDLAFECWITIAGCIDHWTTAEGHKEYFATTIPIAKSLSAEQK